MKIVNSISIIYEEQLIINKILKERVDKLLNEQKRSHWHFISRIKKPESFAQKLETGRVIDSSALEDFFACTLVVENIGAISEAKKIIKKDFKILEERPDKNSFTNKDSSSFIFDDLRLYVN